MGNPELIDRQKIEQIQSIEFYKNSVYYDLNIPLTIDFFNRRFVQPLTKIIDISKSLVVDCGTGHGWFSIAYILAGGMRAIAIDLDIDRLSMAREITEILSISEDIDFVASSFPNLPLPNNSVDIFVSIETLEHVGKDNIRPSLKKIINITSECILITTPNKLFPLIAHDTRLPFAHWLSPKIRAQYAGIFGRSEQNDNNYFLSPFDLNLLIEEFIPVTSCQTFHSYQDFKNQFPIYLPYGSDERKRYLSNASILKSIYYFLASVILGSYSYWIMPSLAHIFYRRNRTSIDDYK